MAEIQHETLTVDLVHEVDVVARAVEHVPYDFGG